MRRLFLIATVAVLTPCVSAQRFGGAAQHYPAGFSRFGGYSRQFAYPFGAYPLGLADPLYADYLSSGYPVASAPPIILMQPQAGTASNPTSPQLTRPAQPLMIELRGDRDVRIDGDETTNAETVDLQPRSPVGGNDNRDLTPSHAPSREMPTILIFRDGRQEEISNYTIAGGVLYTPGNYYTNGSWTRNIEISDLNLSETIESNQSRGVSFRLPAAPNEVIVSP